MKQRRVAPAIAVSQSLPDVCPLELLPPASVGVGPQPRKETLPFLIGQLGEA